MAVVVTPMMIQGKLSKRPRRETALCFANLRTKSATYPWKRITLHMHKERNKELRFTDAPPKVAFVSIWTSYGRINAMLLKKKISGITSVIKHAYSNATISSRFLCIRLLLRFKST